MIGFLVRRFLYMIPLLLVIAILSFALMEFMPGDFLDQFRFDPSVDLVRLEREAARLGLDQPRHIRFWRWFRGVLRGDLGESFVTQQPVARSLFAGRIGWTLMLTIPTFIFTWVITVPLGLYSSTHQYKLSDHVLTGFAFFGMSIPNFFFALLLLYFLVVVLQVGDMGLGVSGIVGQEFIGQPWSWDKFVSFLWHAWPPILVIGTAGMAGLLRFTRGLMIDTLGEMYVMTARAKGLTERTVVYKHALRNILNPFITSFSMGIGGFVQGAMISAIVFNLPTVSRAYWGALQAQDTQVLMGGIIFFTSFFLVGNLLGDIGIAIADPRIRVN
ncbi:ABC transporter permease [Candidatus Bipolaricaulota bacterium]|nr:ABC transporter permease [Candidatus Bipolaricaulota bacterium]